MWIALLIAAALVFAFQDFASGEQQLKPAPGKDGGKRYVQIVVGEIEEVIWKPEENQETRAQIRQELQHLIDYLESNESSHNRLWAVMLQRKLDRKRRELVQFNLGLYDQQSTDSYPKQKSGLITEIDQILRQLKNYQ